MELEQAACGTGNPLADKIRAIMYLEAEKPIDSIDSYLISECADFLAELEVGDTVTEQSARAAPSFFGSVLLLDICLVAFSCLNLRTPHSLLFWERIVV